MNTDIGFVTCAGLENLTPDDRLLFNALEKRGYKCQPLVWDNPGIDWRSAKVVILRSAWDYHLKSEAFLKWINLVSPQTTLINSAELIHWNISKRYLKEIVHRGLPVIPMVYLEHKQPANLLSILQEKNWMDIIVKPAIGLSAHGVKRIKMTPDSLTEGQQQLDNILDKGDVLVQPYFISAEDYGERNLIFINGEYSHCVRKMRFHAPVSAAPNDSLVDADSDELSLAQKVIASISPKPFFARVDLLKDSDQQPCLIELELIDPNLFFRFYPPAIKKCSNGLIQILEKSI